MLYDDKRKYLSFAENENHSIRRKKKKQRVYNDDDDDYIMKTDDHDNYIMKTEDHDLVSHYLI